MSNTSGFNRIIGQQVAKRVLQKAVRENCPAHAYLFVGPQGVGKTTVALEFAKALNCLDPTNGSACGQCVHCQAIEHGNFPDIWVWAPDGKNTKIDQMREMKSRTALPPIRGRWEVNIIEQADTLNEESANSILKLIEEPPPYLVNILLYRNSGAILPTIRSRCQVVRFTPARADELVARLLSDYGCSEDQAAFLAAYSQGCPGKAIRLVGDKELFAVREHIIDAARKVTHNPRISLKAAEILREPLEKTSEESDEESIEEESATSTGTSRHSKKEFLLEALDILISWYTDLLRVKIEGIGATLINSDKSDEIKRQAAQYHNADRIVSCLAAITTARNAVLGNANPQIATEALMMHLSAV